MSSKSLMCRRIILSIVILMVGGRMAQAQPTPSTDCYGDPTEKTCEELAQDEATACNTKPCTGTVVRDANGDPVMEGIFYKMDYQCPAGTNELVIQNASVFRFPIDNSNGRFADFTEGEDVVCLKVRYCDGETNHCAVTTQTDPHDGKKRLAFCKSGAGPFSACPTGVGGVGGPKCIFADSEAGADCPSGTGLID